MSRNGGGDSVEIGARALAAASGADMTIGVMCTFGVHLSLIHISEPTRPN